MFILKVRGIRFNDLSTLPPRRLLDGLAERKLLEVAPTKLTRRRAQYPLQ